MCSCWFIMFTMVNKCVVVDLLYLPWLDKCVVVDLLYLPWLINM